MKRFLTKIATVLSLLTLSATFALAADPASKVADDVKAAKAEAKGVKADATGKMDEVKAGADKKVKSAKSAAKQDLLDINSATDEQLKALPGIGDAYIAKIVTNRPYSNKRQLVTKNVLPEPVYESVKDKIIAKRPAKAAKK